MKSSFQRAREEEQAAYELAVKRASADQVAELNQANREDQAATPAHAAADGAMHEAHAPGHKCGPDCPDYDVYPPDGDHWEGADVDKGHGFVSRLTAEGLNVSQPSTDGLTTKSLPVRPGPEARAAYGTPEPFTLDRAPRHPYIAAGHAKPGANAGPTVAEIPPGPLDVARITRPNLTGGHASDGR